MRISEIWRATVPGHTSHSVLADPGSKSVFVSDGWGVARSGLRLHRLDPETGEKLGEIRTRQQFVSAMVVHGDSLFVATHSRLLRLRPEALSVADHWDRVLPSDAQQLVGYGEFVLAANFRKPVVGLFHLGRRSSTRLGTGLQPLVVRHGDRVKVIEGFDGGVRTFDAGRGALLGPEPSPPVSAVAAGTDMWAVRAGEAQGVGDHRAPPSWLRPGTAGLTRLGADGGWDAELPDVASAIMCDDDHRLLWCLMGNRWSTLVAVGQEDGRIVGSFPAGPGRYWAYYHPPTGLAVAAEPVEDTGGYRTAQSLSTLIAHVVGMDDDAGGPPDSSADTDDRFWLPPPPVPPVPGGSDSYAPPADPAPLRL